MSDKITGGEPVKKIVQCTDADMEAIQSLRNAGFGHNRAAPAPAGGFEALVDLRRSNLSKAKRYENWANATKDLMASGDPVVAEKFRQANAGLLAIKNAGPTASSIHTNAVLTNLSTQYANEEFIGEQLMPPIVVGKKSDVFMTYTKRDRLALPTDDLISENGQVQEIDDTRSTDSYACADRGYKNFIAANAVANQDAPLNEMFDLTEALVEARHLRRELRIMTVVSTATNYTATTNRSTVAAANRWNGATGGNPISDLKVANASLWRGRAPAQTKAVSSLDVYDVLSMHPAILGLFQYNGSSPGLATPQMLARFLGWDDYLVGQARYDTATEGDAVSYGRVWPDFFAVLRVANRQALRSATFGMTLRWSMAGVPGASAGILSQQWFDSTKGLGGTYYAKVGESEAHKVQSADCGHHITTPID